MKKKPLLFLQMIIVTLFLVVGIISCSNEDKTEETENLAFVDKYSDLDQLIQNLNSTYSGQEVLVSIKYEYNENAEYEYKILNEEKLDIITSTLLLKEIGYKSTGLFKSKLGANNKRNAGDKYKLTCSSGGKTTTKTCSGVFSCKKFAGDCLDKGGCLTVCKIKELVYIPPYPIEKFDTKEIEYTLPEVILLPDLDS
ncbi:hypothetical protein [Algibacter pectinivorans]|uniref:Lipoprotein n=1 Tax=Algibacter pectinivorans TaxID=870482 RepID=A0A1I1MQ13_9FLAO|nr:hypothetical protein [Algibacter pectinivorans]SFC87471.1 hypothetical protein SAMN04487987_101447 [Algibacter pectinivorans]